MIGRMKKLSLDSKVTSDGDLHTLMNVVIEFDYSASDAKALADVVADRDVVVQIDSLQQKLELANTGASKKR